MEHRRLTAGIITVLVLIAVGIVVYAEYTT